MKKYSRFSYLLIVYLLGIAYFTVFRLVESWVFLSGTTEPVDLKGLFGYALYTGWRFDTLASCYILALPALMMLIGEFAHIRARAPQKLFRGADDPGDEAVLVKLNVVPHAG